MATGDRPKQKPGVPHPGCSGVGRQRLADFVLEAVKRRVLREALTKAQPRSCILKLQNTSKWVSTMLILPASWFGVPPPCIARYLILITKSRRLLHLQSPRSCNSEIGARAMIKSRVAFLSTAHKQKSRNVSRLPTDQSGVTAALPVPASAPLFMKPSVVQPPHLSLGIGLDNICLVPNERDRRVVTFTSARCFASRLGPSHCPSARAPNRSHTQYI